MLHDRAVDKGSFMKNHQSGFSMVELMITLAILAIGLSLAAPSFTDMMTNNKVTSATNELIGAIQYARAEAAVRGYPVVLCNGNATGSDCASNQTWSGDWLVVGEINPGNKEVIRVFPKQPNAVVVKSPSSTVQDIRFKPNGSIDGFVAGLGKQSFVIQASNCQSGKKHKRDLSVGFLGQTKSSVKDC